MNDNTSGKEDFRSLVPKDNVNIDLIWECLQSDRVNLEKIFAEIDRLSVHGTERELEREIHFLMFMYTGTQTGIKNGINIFRSRKHAPHEEGIKNIAGLTYRKERDVTSLGRFNDIKQPIYYASTNPNVAMLETTLETATTDSKGYCTVAHSKLEHPNDLFVVNLFPQRIEDGVSVFQDSFEAFKHNYQDLKRITDKLPKDISEKIVLIRTYVASRVVARQSNPNFNCYKITSTIAKILFNKFNVRGILYPTIAMGHRHACLALSPKTYDECFRTSKVYRLKYNYSNFRKNSDNDYTGSCFHTFTDMSWGIEDNGDIKWGPYIQSKGKDSVKIDFKAGETTISAIDKPREKRLKKILSGEEFRYKGLRNLV